MSGDGWQWAKAVRCPNARSKAVLKSLASYVGVDGRGWCSIDVLMVETELNERTVQRGLADLKRAGLISETGEWFLYMGRRYPIYAVDLDNGPKNTRERLAQDRAPLGVTPVTPQGEGRGDTGDTPRGDTGDGLGVTPETPKEIQGNSQVKSQAAREADWSKFERLERAYGPSGLKVSDRSAAWTAFQAEVSSGEDPEELIRRAARCRIDPIWKRRDYGPVGLHRWLSEGRHRGWPGEAEDAPPPPEPGGQTAFAGPAEVFAVVAGAVGEGSAKAALAKAGWEAGARTVRPATTWAAGKLALAKAALGEIGVSIGALKGSGDAG